jgi:heat shock protein HtpX
MDNPWVDPSQPNPWQDALAFVQQDDTAQALQPGQLDRLDFWDAIKQNRRNTYMLIVGMLCLAGAFGYVLGWAWDFAFGHQMVASIQYMNGQKVDWVGILLTPSPTGTKAGIALLAAMIVWTCIALTRADKMVLAMAGAREVPYERLPQLHNVVEEVAIAAGIPKPKIYLMSTRMPNAFATGLSPNKAAVGVTTGLLDTLNRRELQGVMAHEIGHILNDDMRYATVMAVMTGVLVFVAQIVLNARRFFYYGGQHQRRGRGAHPVLFIVMILVFMITAILVPILAKLIQMAISRQREYLADATSARLTRDPGGLIAALQKIAASEQPAQPVNQALEPLFFMTPEQMLHNGHKAWLSTHPPVESRIQRLKALE